MSVSTSDRAELVMLRALAMVKGWGRLWETVMQVAAVAPVLQRRAVVRTGLRAKTMRTKTWTWTISSCCE